MKSILLVFFPSLMLFLCLELFAYKSLLESKEGIGKKAVFLYHRESGKDEDFNKYLKKRSEYFTYHPILGVKFRPHSQVFGLSPNESGEPYFDESRSLNVNGNGFIANENQPVSSSKMREFKVIITGGSTVSGWGASNNKKTWPSRLERRLNLWGKKQKLPMYFTVVNAGVFGYSISQEIEYYLNDLRFHSPDMIISFNGVNEKWDFFDTPQNYSLSYHHFNLLRDLNGLDDQDFEGILPSLRMYLRTRFFKNKTNKISHKELKHINGKQIYKRQIKTYAALVRSESTSFIQILQPTMGYCDKKLTKEEEKYKNFFGNRFYRSNWKDWKSYSKELNDFYQSIEKTIDLKDHYNLSCLFKEVRKSVYHDPRHYNDFGQRLLADKVFSIITKKLLTENFISD